MYDISPHRPGLVMRTSRTRKARREIDIIIIIIILLVGVTDPGDQSDTVNNAQESICADRPSSATLRVNIARHWRHWRHYRGTVSLLILQYTRTPGHNETISSDDNSSYPG